MNEKELSVFKNICEELKDIKKALRELNQIIYDKG